jgi:hypothetical protein
VEGKVEASLSRENVATENVCFRGAKQTVSRDSSVPTPLRRATRRPPRQGGTALSRPSRPAWPLSLLFGLGDHMHAYRICVHAILD